jgi:hypothetical protein
MLSIKDLAIKPTLLFTLLFLLNAIFSYHAYKSRYFTNWHTIAAAFIFFITVIWTSAYLTSELLCHAFVFYMAFSILNSAIPVINWKLKGEKQSELAIAGLYPLFGLVLVLVAMAKQVFVSFLFWPVVLCLNALAVFAGLLTSVLWLGVAGLVLTVIAGFIWLSKISQIAALTGFMAVFAVFTVFFMALGVYLIRLLKERTKDFNLENKNVVKAMPYLTAVSPFLLIIVATLKLKPEDPSMIFGFGLLMSVVMLAFARIYYMWPLTLSAMAGAFLLEAVWHANSFDPGRSTSPFIWYTMSMMVFMIFPLIFRKHLLDTKMPWCISALSGLFSFWLIYDLLSRAIGKDFIGVLPGIFAVFYLLVLIDVIKYQSSVWQIQNFRKALIGGVALFFVTLIFPIQFDKELITLGWALEGTALVWLFNRVPHEGLKKWGYCLLLLSFCRLAFNPAVFDYHPRQDFPIFNWYLYTYLIAASSMFATSALWKPEEEKLINIRVRSVLQGCGTILLFLLMNIEIADYFSSGSTLTFKFSGNIAMDMTYTLGWSIFAFILFSFGIKKSSMAARRASFIIFSAAILKLFLHDIWSLRHLYRVGAFVTTAIILIVVSFFYQRYLTGKKSISSPVEKKKTA